MVAAQNHNASPVRFAHPSIEPSTMATNRRSVRGQSYFADAAAPRFLVKIDHLNLTRACRDCKPVVVDERNAACPLERDCLPSASYRSAGDGIHGNQQGWR